MASFCIFLAALLAALPGPAGAQSPAPVVNADEDFHVIQEHPRLMLNARRLKLLRRERDRQSIRWVQFATLLGGKVQMPEPGFALALYSQVIQTPVPCQEAIDWSLKNTDLRQMALVYDWCNAQAVGPKGKQLEARLRAAMQKSAGAKDIPTVRSVVLAAVALADHVPKEPEEILQKVVQQWWRGSVSPALKQGANAVPQHQLYPMMELLHALRDNINIDLRETAPAFFKSLPEYELLNYYPSAYPATENEYHIPMLLGTGDPDLYQAALSRAGDLALVAYDINAQETQFLQGFLIHDRFLMRGTFGCPYEFLWANPYQPGLSYYHMPLSFHDPQSGRLFLRSSWEENAIWYGFAGGEMQLFQDGKVTVLDAKGQQAPVEIGDATVLTGKSPMQFTRKGRDPEVYYIVAMKPKQSYDVEVDDEEIRQEKTDAGGTLILKFPKNTQPGFRLKETEK